MRICVPLLIACLCVPLATPRAGELGKAEQALWDLELAYWEALAARDIEAYMGFWDPDAVTWPASFHMPPSMDEARDNLAQFLSGVDEGYLDYEVVRVSVQVDGPQGVAVYHVPATIRYTDGQEAAYHDRFMHVWRKHKGEWRIVAGMNAPVPRPPPVDAGGVLDEARALTAEGRYAEALEAHVWFFEHALEEEPAMAGVRLSFALGYWMELGEAYPPAIDALREFQGARRALVQGGEASYQVFADMAAIDRVFGEQDATVEQFMHVHETQPDVAPRCYIVVNGLLHERQLYEVCSEYTGDPRVEYARVEELYEMNLVMHAYAEEEQRPEMAAFAEERLVADTARLLEIYVGSGRDEDAAALEAMAREILDNQAMDRAIGAAHERARAEP